MQFYFTLPWDIRKTNGRWRLGFAPDGAGVRARGVPRSTAIWSCAFPRMANGLVQPSQGHRPWSRKHDPILANGRIQFKTCGLMLAVGQLISLRSRSLGRCPRLR
ncbi:hypothetical protein RB12088 [Rhodopirellula baltica SH 1]|uniref:Uncharacterized protein n=1 Tax=Rhodopirellula baltica (strain DSM 10527 / NCIMB 13988 / SH1) TaxID=243090 RepID=Q7UJ68_RHOBA|nr:hypothetical protein RB12088 [Rhodopirellula baltica SH 1]